MPANQLDTTLDRAQFDELLASRNEPAWLTEQRQAAWAAFEAADMPVWRRTNLKGFSFGAFRLAEAATTIEFAGHAGVVVLGRSPEGERVGVGHPWRSVIRPATRR